jgi:hypothetical protein
MVDVKISKNVSGVKSHLKFALSTVNLTKMTNNNNEFQF